MVDSNIYADQASAQRDAMRQRAEIGSDSQLLRGRYNQDFRFTRSALDRALQKGIGQISDDFASRNMYQSGIRKGVQGDLSEGYVDDIGQANMTLQRQLEDLTRAATKGNLGVQTGLEGSLFNSTQNGMQSILQNAMNRAKAGNT
jgi:hypothetical protein